FKVVPAVHEFRAGKLNASLPGLFTKLLVGSEFEKVRPWLAAPTLAWGLTALMGLVLTGLVAWAARPGGAGDRDQLFCLGLVSMTLLSPITWDHSLLLLTLPILWVSQRQTGLAGRLGLAAVVLIFGFHHHGFWKWAEQGGWLPGVFGPLEVLGLASLLCYGQVLLLGLVWAAPGRGQP
ncbi:MAG TPA: hypothetical protein PKD86_17700, partial [Gemmatales bacterium]|nr:hypothetical protein [Gemmatales bacterium]